YWGYEFFANGQALDHFLQEADEDLAPAGLRGGDYSGNVALLAQHLPFLEASILAPYLVRRYTWEWAENLGSELQTAREGDEFDRFDEHLVLDFLRTLGVRVHLMNGHFVLNYATCCIISVTENSVNHGRFTNK